MRFMGFDACMLRCVTQTLARVAGLMFEQVVGEVARI